MSERKILATTYLDICSIYGILEVEEEDGSSSQKRQRIHENIPCSLSKKSLHDIKIGIGNNEETQSHLLFCSDEYVIQAGNTIHVRGDVYKAGKPMVYKNSHQEVPLLLSEKKV